MAAPGQAIDAIAAMTASRQIWDWQSVYPAPAKLNLFLRIDQWLPLARPSTPSPR